MPEALLSTVNAQILSNTGGDYFVTVFYGVLDTTSGRLVYCNACHTPPLHIVRTGNGMPALLTRTGIALGILEDQTWTQGSITLAPGDLLVLYTDGITEACNAQGELYGSERLQQVVRANLGRPAQAIQEALLAAIHAFLGDVPQTDDIALVIVARA